MSRPALAVFASGSGSNFAAIAKAIEAGDLTAELTLLVTDKPEARVAARAERFGVPVLAIDPAEYSGRDAYEEEILTHLRRSGTDFVALAGYMRIVGEVLRGAYPGRIVNLHPSLLPAFAGARAIERAHEAGVSETGVSVHYIDAGIDTGPLIEQVRVQVQPGESLTALQQRIQQVEHELYPRVIANVLAEHFPSATASKGESNE